eukprot:g4864.t1
MKQLLKHGSKVSQLHSIYGNPLQWLQNQKKIRKEISEEEKRIIAKRNIERRSRARALANNAIKNESDSPSLKNSIRKKRVVKSTIASLMQPNKEFAKTLHSRQKKARKIRLAEKREKRALRKQKKKLEQTLEKEPCCASCKTMATELGGYCPPPPPKPKSAGWRFKQDYPHKKWKEAGKFATRKYETAYQYAWNEYVEIREKYNEERRADPGWGILIEWLPGEWLCEKCKNKRTKCSRCLNAPGIKENPLDGLKLCMVCYEEVVGAEEERKRLEKLKREKKLAKLRKIQKKKRQKLNRERARAELERRKVALNRRVASQLRDLQLAKKREFQEIREGVDKKMRNLQIQKKNLLELKRINKSFDPLCAGMKCVYYNQDTALRAGRKNRKFKGKNRERTRRREEANFRAEMKKKNPGWGWANRKKKEEEERKWREEEAKEEEDKIQRRIKRLRQLRELNNGEFDVSDLLSCSSSESDDETDDDSWKWTPIIIKLVYMDKKHVDIEYKAKTLAGTYETLVERKIDRDFIRMRDGRTDTWGAPVDEESRALCALVKPTVEEHKVDVELQKKKKIFFNEMFVDDGNELTEQERDPLKEKDSYDKKKEDPVWRRLYNRKGYTGTARAKAQDIEENDISVNRNRLNLSSYAAKLEGEDSPPKQLTAKERLILKKKEERKQEEIKRRQAQREMQVTLRRLREVRLVGEKHLREKDKLYNRMSAGFVSSKGKRVVKESILKKKKREEEKLAAKEKLITLQLNVKPAGIRKLKSFEWKGWYRNEGN